MIKKNFLANIVLCMSVGMTISVLRFTFFSVLPFHSSDLFAYWSASKLFFSGINPYDSPNLLEFQKQYDPLRTEPIMVWNPPYLFLLFSLFFAQSTQTLRFLISTAAFSTPLIIGVSLKKHRCWQSMWVMVILMAVNYPFFIDVYFQQFTSLLLLVFIAGVLFVQDEQWFFGGALFSVLLVKPHLFFIPLVCIAVEALYRRKVGFFVGGIMTLIILFAATELFFPGITMVWIQRKTWPVEYAGSTTWSLLRQCLQLSSDHAAYLRLFFAGLCLLSSVIYGAYRKKVTDSWYKIAWLLQWNALLIPYGFVFDQTYLLVPLFLYINEMNRIPRLVTLIGLGVFISLIYVYNPSIDSYGMLPISWFFTLYLTVSLAFLHAYTSRGKNALIDVNQSVFS